MASKRNAAYPYIEELKSTVIAVGENARHAHFRNPQRRTIRRVLVDGRLITDGGRADYIVSDPQVVDVIVELKGSDTSRAIEQIRATLPVWIAHELAGDTAGALIVRGHGIHPKQQASIQRWKSEMRKLHSMVLIVETRNREYRFDEFL
jgi:hypothetical protein